MSLECSVAGWLWYCDVHDTHGNADSKEEAEAVSEAHEEFHFLQEEDPSESEGCDLTIFEADK
jgi:hypothetical protein